MTSEEKKKYKMMGYIDTKEDLKKEWLKYVKGNSKDELNFIKVKLTAICMRRLSNAFSCENINEFLSKIPISSEFINEIEDNICYFHKSRSEEYYNFKNSKQIKK